MNKRKTIKVILTSFITIFMIISSFIVPVEAASSQIITGGSTSEKVVALTFDDFAGDEAAAMLSILNSYGVNASFFFLGQSIEYNPDLVKQIYDSGNFIGNHSYSHPYMTQLSEAEILYQLQTTDSIIQSVTGQASMPYFRPPYGDYNSSVLQVAGDAGYTKAIMWTIDTEDYNGISAQQIAANAINNVSPGAIILMHTGGGAVNTQFALPTIISTLQAQGYSFVTIPQLLGDDSGSSTPPSTTDLSLSYNAHVQTYGWLPYVSDGQTAGTTGLYKRMEALTLALSDTSNGGITYRAHVQTYGWQSYVSNGQIAGTTGLYKRMEAIQISLTGTLASQYDVIYRVHIQHYGWLDWVKNGAIAGTTGQALRMEAIEIYLAPKG